MQQAPERLNGPLWPCLSTVHAAIEKVGAREVASVREADRATDIAIAISRTRLAVIRCVQRVDLEDHAALATMVDDGDFSWAGLVYSSQRGMDRPEHVEAFHVSELPRLIDRLGQLRDPEAS